jgi:hypothetical protein
MSSRSLNGLVSEVPHLLTIGSRRMAAEQYRSAQLVFGWSFYKQVTSGGTSSALFGDSDPRLGTAWQKGERLAAIEPYTNDALQVLSWEVPATVFGQPAIEKRYEFASGPPNSAASLFKCIHSATRFPPSRNGVTRHLRATAHGSMIVSGYVEDPHAKLHYVSLTS